MNRKPILLALCGIFLLSLLAGCGGARPLVDDPTISLSYFKNPTEESLISLSKAYAQALNRNRKERVKQPGLAADYAMTLALLGDQQGASQWFNREVADFPASRDYVLQLKRRYCPAFENDLGTAPQTPIATESAAPDNEPSGQDAAVQQVIDEQNDRQAGKTSSSKSKKKPAKKPKKH